MNNCTGVYIVGHFYNYGGYADMAHQYARACEKAGIPHKLIVTGEAKPEVERIWQKSVEASQSSNLGENPYLIVVDIPPRFRLVDVQGVAKVIGSTIFETNTIPKDWVNHCSLMDEIWVPTDFNLSTFEYAGISRSLLKKLPLAIDVEFWSSTKSNVRDRNENVELLCCGSLHRRKGLDKLVIAYYQEFSMNENIRLTFSCFPIKSGGVDESLVSDDTSLENYLTTIAKHHRKNTDSLPPRMRAYYRYWDDEDFRILFENSDGYVSAERANGWALPVMQMMSMGKPVCCLDWGGSTEYVNDSNAVLIPQGIMVPVDSELANSNAWYRGQYWPHMEISDIRKSLRQLYNEIISDKKEKTTKAKNTVLGEYTFEAMGQNLTKLIEFNNVTNKKESSIVTMREHPFEGTRLRTVLSKCRKLMSDLKEPIKVVLFVKKDADILEAKSICARQRLNVEIRKSENELLGLIEKGGYVVVLFDETNSPETVKFIKNKGNKVYSYNFIDMNVHEVVSNDSLDNKVALFFSGGVTASCKKLLKAKGLLEADTYTFIPHKSLPASLKSMQIKPNSGLSQNNYSAIYICDEDSYLRRVSYQNAETLFASSELLYITDEGLRVNNTPMSNSAIFKQSIPKRWSKSNSEELHSLLVLPVVESKKQLALLLIRLSYFCPQNSGILIKISVIDSLLDTNLQTVVNQFTDVFASTYGDSINSINSNITLVNQEETTKRIADRDCGVVLWSLDRLTDFERIKLNLNEDFMIFDIDHPAMRSGFVSAYAMYYCMSREQVSTMRNNSMEKFNQLQKSINEKGKNTVTVFGTGPSLASAFDLDFTDSINIICNTMVKDKKLLQHLQPSAIVASDADFHFGPSVYAQAFRRDLCKAILRHKCYFICPEVHLPLFIAHHPEIKDYCIGIPVDGTETNLDLSTEFRARAIDNVLLQFLFPLASTFGKQIQLVGFDGRKKGDTKFWGHNVNTQYPELMDSIESSHPAFFFFKNYKDYFDRHCMLIEEYVEEIEGDGKKVTTLTESQVPVLTTRLAN